MADIRQAALHGLEGVTFIDSLRDDLRAEETRPAIRFAEETDRIYLAAPHRLRLATGRHDIVIEKTNLPDVVVWNPWVDKSRRMNDFGDDEYLRMLCVETGLIAAPRSRVYPAKAKDVIIARESLKEALLCKRISTP